MTDRSTHADLIHSVLQKISSSACNFIKDLEVSTSKLISSIPLFNLRILHVFTNTSAHISVATDVPSQKRALQCKSFHLKVSIVTSIISLMCVKANVCISIVLQVDLFGKGTIFIPQDMKLSIEIDCQHKSSGEKWKHFISAVLGRLYGNKLIYLTAKGQRNTVGINSKLYDGLLGNY